MTSISVKYFVKDNLFWPLKSLKLNFSIRAFRIILIKDFEVGTTLASFYVSALGKLSYAHKVWDFPSKTQENTHLLYL